MRSPKKPSGSLNFEFNGTIDVGPRLNISPSETKTTSPEVLSMGNNNDVSAFQGNSEKSLLFHLLFSGFVNPN